MRTQPRCASRPPSKRRRSSRCSKRSPRIATPRTPSSSSKTANRRKTRSRRLPIVRLGTDADALRPRGNLVLVPQGVASFARKVLAVEERRPRIAFAVIHEWLTTDGLDEFTLKGAKNALMMQGFDVEDIVLKKKWGESAEPEAAAYTLEETKYERVLDDLAEVNDSLDSVAAGIRQLTAALELFRTAPLDDLTPPISRSNSAAGRSPRNSVSGKSRRSRPTFRLSITSSSKTAKHEKQYEQEKIALSEQENLVEARRMTDLKAKMAKLLGDCDLLIIPAHDAARRDQRLRDSAAILSARRRADQRDQGLPRGRQAGARLLRPDQRAARSPDAADHRDRFRRATAQPVRHSVQQADGSFRGGRQGARRTAVQSAWLPDRA